MACRADAAPQHQSTVESPDDAPSCSSLPGHGRNQLGSEAARLSTNSAATAAQPIILQHLEWGAGLHAPAEAVVAADVVYDPDVLPALVAQLRAHAAHGAHAYVCSTVRQPATMAAFEALCQQSALHLQELHRFGGNDKSRESSCKRAADAHAAESTVQFMHCSMLNENGADIVLHKVQMHKVQTEPVSTVQCYASGSPAAGTGLQLHAAS